MQKSLDQLSARRVRVVAISVDPSEVTRKHAAKQGYTFTFLSDAKAEIIRRYGLLHPGGGPQSEEISLSAEFLLDSALTVHWANVIQGPKARPTGETVLQVLERLAPGAKSLFEPVHMPRTQWLWLGGWAHVGRPMEATGIDAQSLHSFWLNVNISSLIR